VSEPVVDITGVTKQYGALRPLRVERLRMVAGEQLALLGLDQPAAEVFISLLTGASLPDSGSVAIFGQPTADIASSDAWLASLDRFGIVSDRAAVLESMTVVQNLAMPFTLDIEPPPDDVRVRAEGLAR
jgi:ABC-type transporter Mla maintaining outer membrane lipid asymmetry ATPase subunit MlaF